MIQRGHLWVDVDEDTVKLLQCSVDLPKVEAVNSCVLSVFHFKSQRLCLLLLLFSNTTTDHKSASLKEETGEKRDCLYSVIQWLMQRWLYYGVRTDETAAGYNGFINRPFKAGLILPFSSLATTYLFALSAQVSLSSLAVCVGQWFDSADAAFSPFYWQDAAVQQCLSTDKRREEKGTRPALVLLHTIRYWRSLVSCRLLAVGKWMSTIKGTLSSTTTRWLLLAKRVCCVQENLVATWQHSF